MGFFSKLVGAGPNEKHVQDFLPLVKRMLSADDKWATNTWQDELKGVMLFAEANKYSRATIDETFSVAFGRVSSLRTAQAVIEARVRLAAAENAIMLCVCSELGLLPDNMGDELAVIALRRVGECSTDFGSDTDPRIRRLLDALNADGAKAILLALGRTEAHARRDAAVLMLKAQGKW